MDIQKEMTANTNTSDWLILVYTGTHSSNMLKNLISVGSSDNLKIVAEVSNRNISPDPITGSEDWRGVKRFLLEKHAILSEKNALFSVDIGLADDVERITRFLKWGKEQFPSQHIMLILDVANHNFEYDSSTVADSGILYHHQIRQAISTSLGKLDVLCLPQEMQAMIEGTFELRQNVSFVVSSQDVFCADGLDVDFLNKLKSGQHSPEKVAHLMIENFSESMLKNGPGKYPHRTLSAINLSYAEPAINALNSLIDDIIDDLTAHVLAKAARDKLAAYGVVTETFLLYSHYIDLISWTVFLADSAVNKPALQKKALKASAELEKMIVAHSTTAQEIEGEFIDLARLKDDWKDTTKPMPKIKTKLYFGDKGISVFFQKEKGQYELPGEHFKIIDGANGYSKNNTALQAEFMTKCRWGDFLQKVFGVEFD